MQGWPGWFLTTNGFSHGETSLCPLVLPLLLLHHSGPFLQGPVQVLGRWDGFEAEAVELWGWSVGLVLLHWHQPACGALQQLVSLLTSLCTPFFLLLPVLMF